MLDARSYDDPGWDSNWAQIEPAPGVQWLRANWDSHDEK